MKPSSAWIIAIVSVSTFAPSSSGHCAPFCGGLYTGDTARISETACLFQAASGRGHVRPLTGQAGCVGVSVLQALGRSSFQSFHLAQGCPDSAGQPDHD